jgi:hypothetical protein
MKAMMNRGRDGRRGSALLLAMVGTVVLAGLAAAMLAVSGSFKRENTAATDDSRALYVAEAGLSAGIVMVQDGTLDLKSQPTFIGAEGAAVPFGAGGYWTTVVPDAAAATMTVTSFSEVGGRTRGVEAILSTEVESIYDHALFAGNTSGDPAYDLEFGGSGKQADQINGNIYSGGNVAVTGSAAINGSIKATGTISGASGASGSLPVPDIPAALLSSQSSHLEIELRNQRSVTQYLAALMRIASPESHFSPPSSQKLA